jgi:biopolymer transport protein ExbB/TolQ
MNWRVSCARHAAERSAVLVHRDLARGLFGLATVAATAPFLGVFGTLLGIYRSFGGVDGDKTTIMAAIADCLSDALVPTALGVAVALTALFAYQTLSAQLNEFDVEMQAAILDLTTRLRG